MLWLCKVWRSCALFINPFLHQTRLFSPFYYSGRQIQPKRCIHFPEGVIDRTSFIDARVRFSNGINNGNQNAWSKHIILQVCVLDLFEVTFTLIGSKWSRDWWRHRPCVLQRILCDLGGLRSPARLRLARVCWTRSTLTEVHFTVQGWSNDSDPTEAFSTITPLHGEVKVITCTMHGMEL